jgi:enoyl-[acyl-carrier protein] reductase II
MLVNALMHLLGIRHPILQGGMSWISRHELAAAVSEAGALGVIGSGGMDAGELRREIRALRAKTDRPFGVNIPLVNVRPDGDDGMVDRLVDVVLQECVPVVITGGGTPARYTSLLKDVGTTVLHVVPSVRLALKAQDCGVDAVIAESTEAGGHVAPGGLSTMSLVPQVVDALSIPVVAAGGIADARGVAASLVLGASAAQLGTRFIATAECNAHGAFKQALVDAPPQGTAIYCNAWHAGRALRTPAVDRMVEMESAGLELSEIRTYRGRSRPRRGCVEGDVDSGILPAGSAAGLVRDVQTVAEVVAELTDGCGQLLGWLDPAVAPATCFSPVPLDLDGLLNTHPETVPGP